MVDAEPLAVRCLDPVDPQSLQMTGCRLVIEKGNAVDLYGRFCAGHNQHGPVRLAGYTYADLNL